MANRQFYRVILKTTAASVVLNIGLVAHVAHAQAEPNEPISAEQNDSGDIVVTGSLIRNPNLVLSSPVNVTTAEQIELRQSNHAESLLREVPGVVPSFGSTSMFGHSGASFVNLRGMGDNRNIVLLDGARVAPVDVQGRFDLNNIPLALIERVDVLTGGASTTYGADAISGVVNFITKSRFNGLTLNASEQITEHGDGNILRLDVTGGMDYAEGRGNIILSAGYQKVDPVFQGDRPFARETYNSFDGSISGSLWTAPSTFSLPGLGTHQVQGEALVPLYQLYNGNAYSIYQNGFERYNAFGATSFDLTPDVELYARGIYSKSTTDIIVAPGGISGLTVEIPISNPFLTATQRTQFCTANGIDAASCAAASMVSDPTNPAFRSVTSVVSRRGVEWRPRVNESEIDFYDIRAGLRGNLTSSLYWDVSGSYGKSTIDLFHYGDPRETLARDTFNVVPGAGGSPVCLNTASTECAPIDWFGPVGSISSAEFDALEGVYGELFTVSLLQFSAHLSGDVGWTLPWASEAVSFATGVEVRRNRASADSDEVGSSGDISGSAGAVPVYTGEYTVYEAVGEVSVPVISERPFFHDLSLEGGIRYSHYSIKAPTDPSYNTTTWKVGVGWAPIEQLRFRGTYSHAVRAPSIAELFFPQNTSIGTLEQDPCANLQRDGTPIPGREIPTGVLRDTCIAQGVPAGQIGFLQLPAGEANITTGGNINLQPEKSDSYTFGAVISPIPRLNISVDYYNIKVVDAITEPSPIDALNICFDNPSPTSLACLQIRRDPTTGSFRGSQNTVPGIFLGTSNLGRLNTSGIDVSLNYRHDFSHFDWSINATGNWTKESLFQANPSSVVRDCVGVYNGACGALHPELQWSVRNTLSTENFDLSLLWRHIGALQSTEDLYSGPVPDLGGEYDFGSINAYDIFDLTGRYRISERFRLTAAVLNLFNKTPPIVGGNAGHFRHNQGNTFPATYDVLGRRYVLTAEVNF